MFPAIGLECLQQIRFSLTRPCFQGCQVAASAPCGCGWTGLRGGGGAEDPQVLITEKGEAAAQGERQRLRV